MFGSQAAFHRGPRAEVLLPIRISVCSWTPDPTAMEGEVSSNALLEVLVPRNSRISIQFLYGSVFLICFVSKE